MLGIGLPPDARSLRSPFSCPCLLTASPAWLRGLLPPHRSTIVIPAVAVPKFRQAVDTCATLLEQQQQQPLPLPLPEPRGPQQPPRPQPPAQTQAQQQQQ